MLEYEIESLTIQFGMAIPSLLCLFKMLSISAVDNFPHSNNSLEKAISKLEERKKAINFSSFVIHGQFLSRVFFNPFTRCCDAYS